jgi:hypothetical protein
VSFNHLRNREKQFANPTWFNSEKVASETPILAAGITIFAGSLVIAFARFWLVVIIYALNHAVGTGLYFSASSGGCAPIMS